MAYFVISCVLDWSVYLCAIGPSFGDMGRPLSVLDLSFVNIVSYPLKDNSWRGQKIISF